MSDVPSYLRDQDAVALDNLQDRVHTLARAKGWHPIPFVPDRRGAELAAAKLALVHSGLSEALEALRDMHLLSREPESGKLEGVGPELADALIRILDLARWMGLPLGEIVLAKHSYNMTRGHRHGGKLL